MNICEISEALQNWAQNEPIVIKVYIFGSRLKGTHRPDSDLDIAVELRKLPGDEDVNATWIGEAKRLKHSIAKFVPYNVDLQGYNGKETPHIDAYLKDRSLLVYNSIN